MISDGCTRNRFHGLNAGQPFVSVVAAFTDLERYAHGLVQAVANGDFLAFSIAADDARVHTRITARLIAGGSAAIYFS